MMRTFRRVILLATLCAVAGSMSMSMPVGFAVESPRLAQKFTGNSPGDAEQGRAIFNGKGICFYCHGIDADPGQLPQLAPDTSSVIATLNPKPANLREPSRLGLKTEQDRARIIRHGHSGTAMLPDTRLSDEEIQDLVAYLASLQPAGFQNQ